MCQNSHRAPTVPSNHAKNVMAPAIGVPKKMVERYAGSVWDRAGLLGVVNVMHVVLLHLVIA